MKVLSLIILASCAAAVPKNDTDIPFCKHEEECVVFRSSCGKVKALNFKYLDYVKDEFKERESKMQCENVPDTRRYRTTCELNSCTLIEL